MRNDSQVAGDELAAYFRSAEYGDEVLRQSASHTARVRRQRQDFGLARYWRDTGYAHAANVVATITAQHDDRRDSAGLGIKRHPEDSAA